jgi:transcriptional regulator with XRE-family HTH domain
MDERGMSTKELAFRADIAQSTANNLYKGQMSRIDIPVLERVAKALNVPFRDLFSEEPTERDSQGNSLALPLHAKAA